MREEIKLELLQVAREISPAQLAEFCGELEVIRRTAELSVAGAVKRDLSDDVLIDIEQASEILSVSTDILYRNEFSFTRHIGGRRLFSRNGIQIAIRQDDLTPRHSNGKLAQLKTSK